MPRSSLRSLRSAALAVGATGILSISIPTWLCTYGSVIWFSLVRSSVTFSLPFITPSLAPSDTSVRSNLRGRC